jgi:hypothetical protein
MATRVFNELLAHHEKWWPKRHPSLTTGDHNTRMVNKNYTSIFLNQFYFIMTITWLFHMVMDDNKLMMQKMQKNAGNFDHHGDATVQCRVHCLTEHIKGFTRSH